jgi:hypothetical protein
VTKALPFEHDKAETSPLVARTGRTKPSRENTDATEFLT